ncbi:MAG: ATP synthase F1 subunit delta [Acidobacteriaceae bacterium]
MALFAARYAQAFAAVVVADKLDVAVVQQQLADYSATLTGSGDLREVLGNPSIPKDQKLKVVDAIAGKIGLFQQVRNFIAVLMEHDRLLSLDEVIVEYSAVMDAQQGIVVAEIFTTSPLGQPERAGLEEKIAVMANAKIRAIYREDASLLGGVVVRIGSTVYDGSVRGQLQQLKQELVAQ